MSETTELPCADKVAFDTREKADATATTSEWWYGTKMQAYVCQYCHLWHLSTNS